jgi:uncharacterized protein (TIGR00369 family)
MTIQTHQEIDRELCGAPLRVEDGFSQVQLRMRKKMAVDEKGLVHGGFVFGLADHAAMIAVNHPNVVLGAARVKFLRPVRVNDTVIAEARVTARQGKKNTVHVTVKHRQTDVFDGEFVCFILDRHVLSEGN